MSSEKQIEANRRNAQHSTGPRSISGKLRSRGNSLKSGLHAKALLLPSENRREYQRLRTAFLEEFAPVGPTEETLVEIVVDDAWRLVRLRLIDGEFLKQLSSKLEHPMRVLNDKGGSVDAGRTLLGAYVRQGHEAPMEEISRQRRSVTRDFFINIEALRVMQIRRKTSEVDK